MRNTGQKHKRYAARGKKKSLLCMELKSQWGYWKRMEQRYMWRCNVKEYPQTCKRHEVQKVLWTINRRNANKSLHRLIMTKLLKEKGRREGKLKIVCKTNHHQSNNFTDTLHYSTNGQIQKTDIIFHVVKERG